MPPRTPSELNKAQESLGDAIWSERVRAAEAEGAVLAQALTRVRAGEKRGKVLGELFPERPTPTMLTRLRRYEDGGTRALIDLRVPRGTETKVTEEVRGALRVLAQLHPTLGSEALAEKLHETVGVRVAGSTLRPVLAELGLARARGRPGGASSASVDPPQEDVTPLAFAGAELLLGVELQLGAIRALTEEVGEHLSALPAPEGEVLDDRAGRDAYGRFQADYNEPQPRLQPDLGHRFNSVEERRKGKDLRGMRLVQSSFDARYRKDVALTMLPVVLETPRWSGLGHWSGAHLASLVGRAYMPATLDKHARELKLAGAAERMRTAVSRCWMSQDGLSHDGSVLVYVDGATKPLWTHHFTRSLKVSSTGRVMPGVTTVWLTTGSGTAVLYRSFSGTASLRQHVTDFLKVVDDALGEGQLERVVVFDREGHATWLLKELADEGWDYIVPIKSASTGPNARFEDVQPWEPYGERGDQVCDGWLWLNDSRPGEDALRVRVVGRRRHRTGKVAWYATGCDAELVPASVVIDRYFGRWPLQEHVFRTGNGRVGLDVHHGYGKTRVTQVAVVNELEKLEDKRVRCRAQHAQALEQVQALTQERADWQKAEANLRDLRDEGNAEIRRRIAEQDTLDPRFAELHAEQLQWQGWLDEARDERDRVQRQLDQANSTVNRLAARIRRLEADIEKKTKHRTIYTVDTELDEIMTAYKVTFMNLAQHLMTEHTQDAMELDTLIRSVLTLPGERVTTATTEVVRIHHQPRDPRAMRAVQRACDSLNALSLERNGRSLRFELGPVAD